MKKHPVLWTLKQIRNRIPAIFLMTAAHVGNALLGVFFALGSRNVIDTAVSGDSGMFFRACGIQAIIIIGILLCLLVFRHLKDRLTADLDRDWKKRLVHGLLHGEYSEVSRYHSAELLNRLNNDVAKVNDGVLSIVPSGAAMLTRLGAAVAVLGALDLRFTLLIALLGMAAIGATGLMRRYLKDLNKQVSEHDGRVSGYLQETMEKLLMVQAMDVSQEVERRTGDLLSDRYDIQRKRKNLSLLSNLAVSIMVYGAGFLALVWCAGKLLRGQMSFGTLTAVIQLVNQLQSPFVNLSGVLPKYMAMIASAERLMELEDIQGQPEPSMENPLDIYREMTAIRGEALSFAYDRDQILRDASFTIPKGTFVAVTGSSGMGKSTLLKLLLGVFRQETGKMWMDTAEGNVPLERSCRPLFAYVPQGNLLFSGTIRDNLTLIRPDATDQELDLALYVSAMDEFLPALPMGLDTPMGENGGGLSEGQAQRLAIARAVLGGAPVLLLDECTSALDEETERKVLTRLRELPDRTCLAVSHRPAAMQICDMRLEICDGKINIIQL